MGVCVGDHYDLGSTSVQEEGFRVPGFGFRVSISGFGFGLRVQVLCLTRQGCAQAIMGSMMMQCMVEVKTPEEPRYRQTLNPKP